MRSIPQTPSQEVFTQKLGFAAKSEEAVGLWKEGARIGAVVGLGGRGREDAVVIAKPPSRVAALGVCREFGSLIVVFFEKKALFDTMQGESC